MDAHQQSMESATADAAPAGPLQAARSAVRHLNCSLDGLRGNISRILPRQRYSRCYLEGPLAWLGLQNDFTSSLYEDRSFLIHGLSCALANTARGTIPEHPLPPAPAGDSAIEAVFTSGISSFLNLYNTALLGRIILTWFPSAPAAIVTPLATVCDPYLNLFRGIIPPLGGTLDLSPILAFVALDFFTNAAAALPCEGEAQAAKQREARFQLLSPSQAALAFRRRMAAQRRRRQEKQQQQQC